MRDKNEDTGNTGIKCELGGGEGKVSVRDQLDCERRPLVVILLNIHANLKDS